MRPEIASEQTVGAGRLARAAPQLNIFIQPGLWSKLYTVYSIHTPASLPATSLNHSTLAASIILLEVMPVNMRQ